MGLFNYVILPIVCSLVASRIFWHFSFKRSNVRIKFADKIEKSTSSLMPKGYRYRLKLINIGNEDMLEVSFYAKLFIKRQKTKNSCYLSFGHKDFTPILYGKKWQNKEKNKNTGFSWTIELGMADTTFHEFSKRFYPTNIREAAIAGTLSLDEIIDTFKDDVQIAIYAFGYDSVTGSRKMFVSKRYSVNDILEGSYRRHKTTMSYNEYINHLLSIDISQSSNNSSVSNTDDNENDDV